MLNNAIEAIKVAEETARKIKSDADAEAKRLLDNAQNEGQALLEQAKSASKTAMTNATHEAEVVIEKEKQKAFDLPLLDKNKTSHAVDFVMKGIFPSWQSK